MNQNGNIALFLSFIFLTIVVVVTFMFVVLAPAMQSYYARIYVIGEPLIQDANTTTNTFEDLTVANNLRDTLQDQKDDVSLVVEVLGLLNKYAWLFVIVIVSLVFLLGSRALVERQVGGIA